MKQSGASSAVGVDSESMRNIFAIGQAVLSASQRSDGRLGRCRLVAYLFRRPPGRTFMDRLHNGAWGFLLFDMKVFMNWQPQSTKSPRRLFESGGFIKEGRQDELELPAAYPLGPTLVSNPRPRLNRWSDLAGVAVALPIVP